MFDNVWSCNDFGTTKADTAIYHMAAERMGVGVGDVIFLDDNLNADKTAKQAGMIVYGVYDDSSAEYVDEMKAATDKFSYFQFLLVIISPSSKQPRMPTAAPRHCRSGAYASYPSSAFRAAYAYARYRHHST